MKLNDLEDFPSFLDSLMPIKKWFKRHIANKCSNSFKVNPLLLAINVLRQNKRIMTHKSKNDVQMMTSRIDLVVFQHSL